MKHASKKELQKAVEEIMRSPSDGGTVQMIVRRPSEGEREVLPGGRLSPEDGLEGDNWKTRGSKSTPDGKANPETQVTLMNTRVISAIAGTEDRWPLAGDQIFVDLDLGPGSLPPGARFRIGEALLEVSKIPHTGCKKFAERFGVEATKFVGSASGRENNFRGINAIVIEAGEIKIGDIAWKDRSRP